MTHIAAETKEESWGTGEGAASLQLLKALML